MWKELLGNLKGPALIVFSLLAIAYTFKYINKPRRCEFIAQSQSK